MSDKPPAYDPAAQPAYPPQQQGYPPQQQGYPPPQQGYPPQQQTTTTVVMQPGQIPTVKIISQFPQNIICPHCQANVLTATELVNGSLTWLSVGGLFMIGCWLCCWIPFVVDACKDVVHRCPNCKNVVGLFKHL